MQERVEEELRLLRTRYPDLEYVAQGYWIRVKGYPLPKGWNRDVTEVAFQIVAAPAAPYGIYVPSGLCFNGQMPANYNDSSGSVPFPGTWGMFSWSPGEGEWRPGATVSNGTNYLNWALGFSIRFEEGV